MLRRKTYKDFQDILLFHIYKHTIDYLLQPATINYILSVKPTLTITQSS